MKYGVSYEDMNEFTLTVDQLIALLTRISKDDKGQCLVVYGVSDDLMLCLDGVRNKVDNLTAPIWKAKTCPVMALTDEGDMVDHGLVILTTGPLKIRTDKIRQS